MLILTQITMMVLAAVLFIVCVLVFRRRTVASLALLVSLLVAAVFIYFGLFNVTGEIAKGSFYLGLIIFSCGLYFYNSYRSGFSEVDLGGLNQKLANSKIDLETTVKAITSLEPFLKYNHIPYTIIESSLLSIPGSTDQGIEIFLSATHDNMLVKLNGFTIYFNYYRDGKAEAITLALGLLHACLCQCTVLTIFGSGESVNFGIKTVIADQEVELYPIEVGPDMDKLAEFKNTYLEKFVPREFQ